MCYAGSCLHHIVLCVAERASGLSDVAGFAELKETSGSKSDKLGGRGDAKKRSLGTEELSAAVTAIEGGIAASGERMRSSYCARSCT
jgi:hypothetical protein